MRKTIVAFIVAALVSAMGAAPAFANGWGSPYPYQQSVVVNPILWPIAAALTLPAAIVGTVANVLVPPPVAYGYSPAPVYSAPPPAYYPAGPYYYAPRVYAAPRAYYAPRGYYHARPYRYYRGW